MFHNVGRQIYNVHSIEFQKRGLPHAHILIKFQADCTLPTEIDTVVSAEIPDDSEDAALVRQFILHHHPSPDRPASTYCQHENADSTQSCRFHYPHPLLTITTIDNEGHVHYQRQKQGDEWVVPYCLPLLRKFRCHLNFEVANSPHLFQYLF